MFGRGNVYRAFPRGGMGPGRALGPRGFGMHLFPFGGFFVFLIAVIVIGVVIYALWHAFRKAGLHPEWSLLALIPVVGVPAALLILAFEEWPALRPCATPVAPAPGTPATTAEGDTVLVPTTPMTTPTEPVVPATAPDVPSAEAASAPTEAIEGAKRPREPKGE